MRHRSTASVLAVILFAFPAAARDWDRTIRCDSGCCPQPEFDALVARAADHPSCEELSEDLGWNEQYYRSCAPGRVDELWDGVRTCYATRTQRLLEARYAALAAKPAELEAEKKLQSAFATAAEAICAQYKAVCSERHADYVDCLDWADAWRAQQLAAESHKAMSFPPGAPAKAGTRAWDDFAAGLCALPAAEWKGGKKPAACEARVKASLEQKVKDTDRSFGC